MRRLVTRYFLIYMSFLIALMALLVPMYFVTMNELEENTRDINEEALSAGLARFDDELNTALQVAIAMYEDQYISYLSYMRPEGAQPTQKDAYQMMHALQNFNTLSKMLAIAPDSGLLLVNGVVIASNRIHLSQSDYYGVYLKEANCADYSQWKRALTGDGHTYKLARMRVAASLPEQKCVVFSVGVPLFSSWNSVFYAVFNEKDVLNMLALPEALENGALKLYWRDELLIDYAAQKQMDTVSISAAGGIYGLSVELALDRALISGLLRPYRVVALIALAGFALGGLAMAFIYARRNARPMARLLRAAEEASGELDANEYSSGYDYMGAFIRQVDKKLKDNRLKLANQEATIRDNLLERLLRGDINTQEHYVSARAYLPDYPSPCRMFLARLEDAELLTPQQQSNLQLQIHDVFASVAPAPVILHDSSDVTIAFLRDDARETLASLSQRIGGEIATRTGMEYQLCVSEPCANMEQLHRAFLRAQNALRLNNQPIQILEPHVGDEALEYAGVRYSDKFYELLSHAQLDSAIGYMNEDIFALLQYQACGETEVQQLFYAYRLAISRVLDDNELAQSDEPDMRLPQYARCATVQQACEPLKQFAETLCARVARTRLENINQFEQSVLAAVDRRLSDPDLSVQMMMVMFSISAGTLQRIMRATSGRSFLEYVTHRRMALAKELLTTTDTPIREIVQMTGYQSENSFYKTFKRRYGTSPAAMRAEAANEAEQ